MQPRWTCRAPASASTCTRSPATVGALRVGGPAAGPASRGCAGHSDGDVAAHAACDALFAAAGLGDLGHALRHRPARAGRCRRGPRCWPRRPASCTEAGFVIGNVAVQVIGNRPKLGPRRDEAQAALSAACRRPGVGRGDHHRRPRAHRPRRGCRRDRHCARRPSRLGSDPCPRCCRCSRWGRCCCPGWCCRSTSSSRATAPWSSELVAEPEGSPREFGVVAIRSGREVGEDGVRALEALYPAGCTAQVEEVTALDDGRYEVVSVGCTRFRAARHRRDGRHAVPHGPGGAARRARR